MILSWASIEEELAGDRVGRNLILHEFSHKLDMLNGRANGFPPLHPEMDLQRWSRVLNQAFIRLQERIFHDEPGCIDDDAATNPAEFFAVTSEYFLCLPMYCSTIVPRFMGSCAPITARIRYVVMPHHRQ